MIEDTLLISCPGADGGLFIINTDSTFIRISSRATTGLFVDNNELIFAYQTDDGKSIRVVNNHKIKDEIILSDKRLDLHDVLVSNEKLYVVATDLNSVICLDKLFKETSSWSLPGENDSAHINSVAVYDGRLLASVFGRFTKHREYKNGTIGLGEIVDIQSGETYISGLSQPHSLTPINDLLYVCSSEEKELRIYRKRELIKKILLPGYARGVAISGDNIYVGISISRNAEYIDGRLKSAAVAVIDSKTKQLKNSFNLPCMEIYDIRVVTESNNVLQQLLIHSLAERDAEIGKLNQVLAERDAEIGKLNQVLTERDAQISAIYSSTSWRITKPIRAAKRLLVS
ncbi:MAG: DUF4915 domain-containing protein [Methylophilaceae bacterium]